MSKYTIDLAKRDFYKLREVVAEQGFELTPEELRVTLEMRFGGVLLTDRKGICDHCSEVRENKWYGMMTQFIGALFLVTPLDTE